MLTRIAIGLMAGTLLSAPAFAQATQAPATPRTPAATAPANQGAAAQQGQAMGGNIQYITQNRADLWRASQLEGINVYNQNNEKVGDIREVLVDKQGRVEAVVIGVGGFLGIGERDVAVPFTALQWVNEPRTAANTTATGAAGTTGAAGGTMGTAGTNNTAAAPAGTARTGNTAATGTTATTGTTAATGTAGQPATTGAVGVNNDTQMATRGDRMRDYPERAILPNATKEQLENAPEFRYAQ